MSLEMSPGMKLDSDAKAAHDDLMMRSKILQKIFLGQHRRIVICLAGLKYVPSGNPLLLIIRGHRFRDIGRVETLFCIQMAARGAINDWTITIAANPTCLPRPPLPDRTQTPIHFRPDPDFAKIS